MKSTRTTELIDPVRKSVLVEASVEHAFHVFTERMADWWPVRTHSVHEHRAETVGIEPRVGGVLYEIGPDGREPWGTVTAWEPPRRLAYTWHPGHAVEEATEVDVRFTPQGNATLVEVEHRGWEARGAEAAEIRAGYETGWEPVLARFAEAAGS